MPTIAFLFCLLGGAAFPSPLRIDIVFQGVKLSSQLKASALEEATRIWRTYDVELHETSSAETRKDGAVRLSVSVADRPSPRVGADALGSIYFVNGSPTALILLYPNTIAALVPTAILTGPGVHERSLFDYDRMLGRVTGRALAHEIGHYLLRSRNHSEHGLMRARPHMTEMIELNRRGFLLADADVTRLMSLLPEHSRSHERVAPSLEECTLGDVLAPGDRGVVR